MTADLLSGVRVLDLTNVLAGPFAGYQLALMGADVLKVEVPRSGDLARNLGASGELSGAGMGISFLAQNASKRSVTLNLKSVRGKELFTRLVQEHDVLVENFRPGVMERLGLGWDTLREVNPGLVYCAISGFGQEGPLRDRPAYDQIVQGMSGLMSVTGTPEAAPLRVGAPVCDTMGGLAAAFGIAAALVRKGRTGEGSFLDVSMLDTALSAMGWVASDYLMQGSEPVPMGNENRTSAPSGTFSTADGALNIAANKQEQFETLCAVLDRPELLTDPRFATRDQRKEHRHELRAELETTLATRPSRHWDTVLAEVGIPAAPVATVPEALTSAQVVDRELITPLRVDLEGGEQRDIRVLGSPIHVDGAAARPSGPPPRLGADTDAVLAAVGLSAADIDQLREEGVI